jgi:heat shock protein HslJ
MSSDTVLRNPRAAAGAFVAALVLAACALPQPGALPGTGASGKPGPPAVAVPAPAPPPAPRLEGSSWYWIGTRTPARLVAPSDPGAFNLEFLDGGQFAVQIDCNTGGGTWSHQGGVLTIGPLRSTRKPCPTAVEADRFSQQLAMVRSARVEMGLLELSLGEAGQMLLARDPDWTLRGFDCPNGSPPLWVAFGRDQAVLRWRGNAWQMRQQPTGSGTRYASGNAILFRKGTEATLVNEGKQVAGPCIARR